MWACGPQAVTSASVEPTKIRSRIWMALLLKGLPSTSHLRDANRAAPCSLQLESSCASHVRTRTIPLRHCFSSATTAQGLRSVVLRVPDRSNATRDRYLRPPTPTLPCAARAAAEPPITSPARLRPTARCTKLALRCACRRDSASRGRISGDATRALCCR